MDENEPDPMDALRELAQTPIETDDGLTITLAQVVALTQFADEGHTMLTVMGVCECHGNLHVVFRKGDEPTIVGLWKITPNGGRDLIEEYEADPEMQQILQKGSPEQLIQQTQNARLN